MLTASSELQKDHKGRRAIGESMLKGFQGWMELMNPQYIQATLRHITNRNKRLGVGEMAPHLRAKAALLEDPGSSPSAYVVQLTGVCNSHTSKPDVLFWHCTQGAQIYIQTKHLDIELKF